jgi:hypothetical protein
LGEQLNVHPEALLRNSVREAEADAGQRHDPADQRHACV